MCLEFCGCNHPLFGRKQHYVRQSKRDWDVDSAAGKCMRKKYKPLKVRRSNIVNSKSLSVIQFESWFSWVLMLRVAWKLGFFSPPELHDAQQQRAPAALWPYREDAEVRPCRAPGSGQMSATPLLLLLPVKQLLTFTTITCWISDDWGCGFKTWAV